MDSSGSSYPLNDIDDAFFDDLTHPITKDFDHKTWTAFANDLTSACASFFPPNKIQYHTVHALLLNWEFDDLGTEVELQALGEQLRRQFNFATEFWKIPTQESENELEKKMSQVKAGLEGEGNLLIVYYGGHGQWNPRNRSIWAANGQLGSPTLNWSELQPMLIRASCDVLIVLDCCFAGSAGRSNVKGTKELLAACGMEATAEGVSDYSFTRNLIDKLRSFGTDPFTVSELYERLVKAKRRLRNTPQYIPLTGRDRSSIRIARLRSNSPVIMNNSILSLPSSSSSSNNFPLSSASNSLTSSSTSLNINRRVLLAVSLETDSPLPEVESWKRWLASDAPTYIQRIDVRIEDAYPSNSTLVLVSMPISVWCHLPDTTAYRFVSFITGGSIFKIASYSPDLENAILQNFPDPDSISQSKTASYALPLSSIDRKPMHLQMARMCIQFLSINLKADICKLRSPAFLRRNMGAQKLLEYVSKEAQYACRYWSEHLEVGQGSISDGDDVHTFLLQHFLHWLEAMSWTGLSSECVHIIYRLQSLLKPGQSVNLSSFLYDASRFIMTNRIVMEIAPLQIYSAALIFAPAESIVRNTFIHRVPPLIAEPLNIQRSWGPCLQILEGNSGSFLSVTFAPNGKQIACGTLDNTVQLWDWATGTLVQTLKGHSDSVYSVAFSSDGEQIVSGSADHTVRLWDTATGKLLQTLEGHLDLVNSVAFSPDSNLVVSGSNDRTVKLWDTVTGVSLQTLDSYTLNSYMCRANSVRFSPNGKQITCGTLDNTVQLWDSTTGTLVQTLKGHSDSVYSVAFSSDGEQIVSGSADHTVRLWDTATGKLLQTLEGHLDLVNSVAFSPDSNLVVSGSDDLTVRLWDAITGKLLQRLEGHSDWITSVAFSPDGKKVASGSADHTVRLWDAITREAKQTLNHGIHSVKSINFSPNGRQVVSGSMNVQLWDATTGRLLRTLEGHLDWITSVAFSLDAKQVVSGSDDHTVRLWDAITGKLLHTLEGHGESVTSVAFSPDSRRVASGSADHTVKIWDAIEGIALQILYSQSSSVISLAFSPDGTRLVTGSRDKTVRLWDTVTGLEFRILEGHTAWVTSVAFSSDGKQVVSGSDDDTVHLWDVATGATVRMLKNYPGKADSVVFSSDGNAEPTLYVSNNWVTEGRSNLLWLPLDYRAKCAAVWNDAIALGHLSGHISVLKFKRGLKFV